ncbi:MAG: T9SS type A sorting domain-containing protein [Bacteroidetes bacterium]|nr:T9SS type A sorting domain-containing protein [Bacteroidota bacterium]
MKKAYSPLLLMFSLLLSFQAAFAGGYDEYYKKKMETPNGDPLSTSRGFYWANTNSYEHIVSTSKGVWLEDVYQPGKFTLIFDVGKDATIVSVTEKLSSYGRKGRTASAIVITLSDNTVVIIDSNGDEEEITASALTLLYANTGEMIKDMAGDDMYAITGNYCYISSDSAHTWLLDTAGLTNLYFYNLSFDSLQRVYLSTNFGLYTQDLGSMQWVKNTALTGTSCSFVYVDRFQNIWAKTNTGFYVSTDRGLSFLPAPAGITGSVVSMADDIYGNVYVISTNVLYKSVGGIQTFMATDGNIVSQINETVAFQTFNKVSADSFVFVATKYGSFTSYDQGTTWTYGGVPSRINYGIAKTSSGRLLVSNNVGVHSREANDTVWSKRFPASGFETAAKIFKDNSGNLYTTSQSNKLIWKSTDGGTTWNLDTASYANTNGNVYSFYTDPLGNQHAYVLASPPLVYTKNGGGSWTIDTVGFTAANFSTATAWGTDNNGNLYLATPSVYLQKRPIGGGAWVTDTAGLLNQATIYDLAVDGNGTLWAGTYIGAFKRVCGVWQQLTYPVGTQIGVTNSCFVVSVDGAGAVWTQWSYFNTLGHAIGSGVYFTLDSGTNWTSMSFDSITFRQLYSVGDTTYAISYADGLFRFTRDGGTVSVHEIKDATASILLYPNPAQNKLTVELSETVSEISVLDVSGRKLKTITGNFSGKTEIDISSLPKGNYLLLLRETQNMKTVKFVKQ